MSENPEIQKYKNMKTKARGNLLLIPVGHRRYITGRYLKIREDKLPLGVEEAANLSLGERELLILFQPE
jgi:hypothetical protein